MIPYARQDINQADIDAVVAVLSSDLLTQGPVVPTFEKTVADYCGAQHAVAVNSATSALHIACLALGVGKGDSVWTTPTTFVASANCALYCGATVDFVDIDPRSYNLSVDRLAEKLAFAKETGKLPKAWMTSTDPDRPVPLLLPQSQFLVVVAGDPMRNRSCIFRQNFKQGYATSRKVRLPANWEALRRR